MGFFSSGLLSSKYTTAIIINEDNRAFFVPIKYVIGNVFFTNIEHQLYCFRLDGTRQVTYRHTLAKSFKFYIYHTEHFLPVSPEMIQLLEDTLKANSLPKTNMFQFSALKILGAKEKHNEKEFTVHDLSTLIEEVGTEQEKYPREVESITKYIKDLGIKEIVTPVKRLSEFLEGDLLTTNAGFLGNVTNQHKLTDKEQKKMANVPDKGKGPLLKIILLVALIGCIGGIGYFIYSSGMIQGVTLPGATPGSGPLTQSQILSKYSTPESLKCAIAKGDVDYKQLPPTTKAMVDKTKMPATC